MSLETSDTTETQRTIGNLWYSDLPKKGWILQDVIDTEACETVCDFCSTLHRYVHKIFHPDIIENYEVGCICAEKLTGDYVNPKGKEKLLRQRAEKITRWIRSSKWNFFSYHPSYYRKEKNRKIWLNPSGAFWKIKINNISGKRCYENLTSAKKAALFGMEWMIKNGKT